MSDIKQVYSKEQADDAEWWAMRLMLTGMEMYEGSLSDWWNLDDDEAARAFDVFVGRLNGMVDVGLIPRPELVVGDDGLRSTEFSDEAVDKWFNGGKDGIGRDRALLMAAAPRLLAAVEKTIRTIKDNVHDRRGAGFATDDAFDRLCGELKLLINEIKGDLKMRDDFFNQEKL